MKSRINWISLGDKNTKFFHQNTIIRRKNNNILCLTRDDGTITWNSSEISFEILTFFKDIYSLNHLTNDPPPHLFIPNLPTLSLQNQSSLIHPPNELEIKTACLISTLLNPLERMAFMQSSTKKIGTPSNSNSLTPSATSSLLGHFPLLGETPFCVLFPKSTIPPNPPTLDLQDFA